MGRRLLSDYYRYGSRLETELDRAIVAYNRAKEADCGITDLIPVLLSAGDMYEAGEEKAELQHDAYY